MTTQQQTREIAELRQIIIDGPSAFAERFEKLTERYPAHFLQHLEELGIETDNADSLIQFYAYCAAEEVKKAYKFLCIFFLRRPRNSVEGKCYTAAVFKLTPHLDKLAKQN